MATNLYHQLLTTTQAANHLGITADELGGLRRTRTGPDWVKLGRTVRYIADDLDWWLDQQDARGSGKE